MMFFYIDDTNNNFSLLMILMKMRLFDHDDIEYNAVNDMILKMMFFRLVITIQVSYIVVDDNILDIVYNIENDDDIDDNDVYYDNLYYILSLHIQLKIPPRNINVKSFYKYNHYCMLILFLQIINLKYLNILTFRANLFSYG